MSSDCFNMKLLQLKVFERTFHSGAACCGIVAFLQSKILSHPLNGRFPEHAR